MKMYVTFVLAALLLTSMRASAQSFTVSITPAVQTITVGESATYSVVITPLNGYNATVFLSVDKGLFQGSCGFSTSSPNPPYSNITLTCKPTLQDTGTRTFIIRAKNKGIEVTASCLLNIHKNSQWARIQSPLPHNALTTADVSSLQLDKDSTISFGTYQRPERENNYQDSIFTFHFRNQHWETESFRPSLPDSAFSRSKYEYIIDKTGMFWFTTEKSISKYDGNFITTYDQSNSGIVSSIFRSMFLGKNGYPVVIAEDERSNIAISRFDGSIWTSFKPEIPLNGFSPGWGVGSCMDSAGGIWVTTHSSGLVHISDTTQDNVNNSSNPAIYYLGVRNVLCDKDGEMWCMYVPNYTNVVALSHLDGTQWQHIPTPYPNIEYFSMMIDDQKNIWLGTMTGLVVYLNSTGEWKTFNKDNSPLSGWVTDIIQDKNKNIWMTVGEAYYVFNPNGLVDMPLTPLAVEELRCITDVAITISPNPTSTSVTLAGLSGITSFRVVNSLGMDMGLGSELAIGASQEEINVSGLVAGIYFVQLRTPTGMITKPMMVVR
jgi:hypothetical protein